MGGFEAIEHSMGQLQDSLGKVKLSPDVIGGSYLMDSNAKPIVSEIRGGWQQLLIIGNGFDLECGLRSNYSNFFEPRKNLLYPSCETLDDAGKSWREHIVENGITVWDVILEECSGSLWNDIEKAIALWVLPETKNDSSHFQRLLSLLNPEMDSDIDPEVRRQFSWRNYAGSKKDDIKEAAVARFILQTCDIKRKNWNIEKLYSYLRAQLDYLEREFKAFMLRQLDSAPTYFDESWKLLSEMISPYYPTEENTDTLTTLLNFNYTNPAKNKPAGIPLKAINVHGKLNGEIVFGIDGKEHMDNMHVAPFTKTYRLLGLHSDNRFTLFDSVGSLARAGNSIGIIKFYGHSLAEPDYSYFQAIFDEVELYSGNTRLVFYFRSHPSSKDAKGEMCKNVSRLLSEYGQTMNNVDHGKNLMHKLILEGRLSVVELEKSK